MDLENSEEGAISTEPLVLEEVLRKPHKERAPKEKRLVYDESLKAFMQGWELEPKPTVFQVAERYGIPLKQLQVHAERADWMMLRANHQGSIERAEELSRAAAVMREDKVTLEGAERVITQAFDMYVDALGKIRAMGDSTAPRESSEGSPVKSELEVKVLLLARVTQGAMAMANGAKSLGLVREIQSGNEKRESLDPAKLASLSLTIIQNGSARERPIGEVIDIPGVLAAGQQKAPPG